MYEDLYETLPESSLELMFTLLEKPILTNRILDDTDITVMKRLQSLLSKICKLVIKKLSVTQDIWFRGKVQTFIAAALPLTHPSGSYQILITKQFRPE